jgi:hypothetical protein
VIAVGYKNAAHMSGSADLAYVTDMAELTDKR